MMNQFNFLIYYHISRKINHENTSERYKSAEWSFHLTFIRYDAKFSDRNTYRDDKHHDNTHLELLSFFWLTISQINRWSTQDRFPNFFPSLRFIFIINQFDVAHTDHERINRSRHVGVHRLRHGKAYRRLYKSPTAISEYRVVVRGT